MATLLIYGFTNSAVYMLYAIGFGFTYGVSGVANFCHGGIYILSGYLFWCLLRLAGLPFFLSAVLAIILTALLGLGIYYGLLIRVRGLILAEIIITFALGIAILEFLYWIGVYGMEYSLPSFIRGGIEIRGVGLDYQRLFVVGMGLVLIVFLWFFSHHTRAGLACRAISQEERTALSLGIESDWTAALSLALGGALAAIAALVVLPLGVMEAAQGYEILIYALTVVVVGGLGSTMGIVVASFVIGYSQLIMAHFISAEWMTVVPLVFVILILLTKPSGLFGKFKELEERV